MLFDHLMLPLHLHLHLFFVSSGCAATTARFSGQPKLEGKSAAGTEEEEEDIHTHTIQLWLMDLCWAHPSSR
jgi:uncharacterized protein YceK